MKWIISLLLLSMLILVGCAQSELPPEPNAPGATGNYYKAIGDWATESDTFWLDFDESIKCSPGERVNLSFRVDDDFVYKNIYLWAEGEGNWDAEQFSQQTIGNSNWIRNLATYDVEVSCENLLEIADENNEIFTVAYSCSQDGDSFDCNNNKWQLQVFSVSEVAEDYDFFFELNQTHTITTDLMTSYDVTFIGVNSLDRADFYIDGTVYSVAEGESVLLGDLNFEVVDTFKTNIPTIGSSVSIRILAPTIPTDPNAPGSSTGETVVDGDSLFLELNKPKSVSYEGNEYDVELVGGDNECLVPGIDSFEFSINGVSERISTADEGSVVTVGSTDIYVEDIFITNIPVTSSSMNFAVIGQGNNSYFVTNDEVLNTTDGVFAISDTVLEECQQYGDSFVVIDINGNRKTVSEGDFVTISGVDLYIDDVFVTNVPTISASANVVFGADEVEIELSVEGGDSIEMELNVNGEFMPSITLFNVVNGQVVADDELALGVNRLTEDRFFFGWNSMNLYEVVNIDSSDNDVEVENLYTGDTYTVQIGSVFEGYTFTGISANTGSIEALLLDRPTPNELSFNGGDLSVYVSDPNEIIFITTENIGVEFAAQVIGRDLTLVRQDYTSEYSVTYTDFDDEVLTYKNFQFIINEDGDQLTFTNTYSPPSSGSSGGGSSGGGSPVPEYVVSGDSEAVIGTVFYNESASRLYINGQTTANTFLDVHVNGVFSTSTVSNGSGYFEFRDIMLDDSRVSNVDIAVEVTY